MQVINFENIIDIPISEVNDSITWWNWDWLAGVDWELINADISVYNIPKQNVTPDLSWRSNNIVWTSNKYSNWQANNEVSYTSWTIELSDGTSYSVTWASDVSISKDDITYFYYDITDWTVSHTTTQADAVWAGKIQLATVLPTTTVWWSPVVTPFWWWIFDWEMTTSPDIVWRWMDIVFSSSAYVTNNTYITVSHTSWNITLASWTTYTISSWASFNLAVATSTHYIYYVLWAATLSATSQLTTAIWQSKILLAVVKTTNVAWEKALINVFWWQGQDIFINGNQIVWGTVTANQIASNTITASQIATWTITANEIASWTITATQIASNTITANEIASSTITASEIASWAITSSKISANAVTAAKIDVSQLSAISADMWTITAWTITGATVRTASSGTRFQMTSSEIAYYYGTRKRVEFTGNWLTFYDTSWNDTVLYWTNGHIVTNWDFWVAWDLVTNWDLEVDGSIYATWSNSYLWSYSYPFSWAYIYWRINIDYWYITSSSSNSQIQYNDWNATRYLLASGGSSTSWSASVAWVVDVRIGWYWYKLMYSNKSSA